MYTTAILAGKTISAISKLLGLGAGATWPGEIALQMHPTILKKITAQLTEGVIIVAGTNGKTTTSRMITQILEKTGKQVIHNMSGANLLNGVISASITSAQISGTITADWAVFEVDENSLPLVLSQLDKNKRVIVILLNLFRDQLDRYGEVDVIFEKWITALEDIGQQTADSRQVKLILNADDPLVASLGDGLSSRNDSNTKYFGLNDKKLFLKKTEHATDSTFCPNCGSRLVYEGVYFSHLGVWKCTKCNNMRPKKVLSDAPLYPLPGVYNRYNTLAAFALAEEVGIDAAAFKKYLSDFTPAFGRQEKWVVDGKNIQVFLSKNPTGFNASLRTVSELGPGALLLVLNDRIPDGRDVSWIWDIDIESIPKDISIVVSGDRVYDLALRVKYADKEKDMTVEPDLSTSIQKGLGKIKEKETLYILPTYSAMLEVRKILTGKKIL